MSIQCAQLRPCINSQCNKYLKLAHIYNVVVSPIYCCCNVDDVSPINKLFLKGKEHNVLPNKLIDVINGSKPIKRDDKCHNVASQNK